MGFIEVQQERGLSSIRQLGWGTLGAIASGGLLALALPPHDVPLLAFVAFVPVLMASFRAPILFPLLYGLLMAFVACTLMASFTGSYDGFVSVYFLMFGAFASLVLMMARRLCTAGWLIIGVGATGVLVEWIAARLDFPYTIALTVWRNPAFLWLAGWTGVWGLSFLIWTTNAAIAYSLVTLRLQRIAVAMLATLALVHAIGWLELWMFKPSETLRVGVVQGRSAVYENLLAEASRAKVHLVVMPEVCCNKTEASAWARRYGFSIVFGFFDGFFNGAALATPDGQVSEPYYKMHPFGAEAASWTPGQPIRAFASPYGTLGAVICYDTMFTNSCRYQALNGARLIAVPTLDPPNPAYILHRLHAAITPLRAAEHRVPMARSEYRGASMIVDGYGRVLAEAGVDEDKLVVADVPLGDGHGTLYTRLGDYFVVLSALLMAVALWRSRGMQKPVS
jgi:apolipoprotein N-acyltransferase